MENVTEEFEQGNGLLNFKVYEGAISLFKKDLEKNPKNLASYHNIGLAETYLGVDKKNIDILKSAIEHLEKAIEIAKEINYKDGYLFAETNLKWAKAELEKLM